MNRSEQTVAVKIPLHVWGRLASAAENRGVTVADLIVAGVDVALKKVPAVPSKDEKRPTRRCNAEQRDRLRRLILAGKATEAEIAAAVGCHPNTVTNWKRKLREEGALHV